MLLVSYHMANKVKTAANTWLVLTECLVSLLLLQLLSFFLVWVFVFLWKI